MQPHEIHQLLAEGPAAIETAANDVAEKKAALDEAKRKLAKAEALATFANKDNAKNTSILQAIVTLDPEVDLASAALVVAQKEYLLSVSRHERAKDNLDVAKKHSNLIEAETRAFGSQRHQ